MARQKYTAKGAEALFGVAFLYGLTGVLVREVSSMWGDKAQAAARYCLVFIYLAVYSSLRKTKHRLPRAKLPYALALGLAFAVMVLCFTFSIQKTTIANTLFNFYAANLVSSFMFGTFWLKESVNVTKVTSISLTLIGLSFYADALLAGNLGIALALSSGVVGGAANVLIKKLSDVNKQAVMRIQYGTGAFFTVLITWLSGDQIIRTVSVQGVLLTLFFSAVLLGGGILLLYGYEHFDVNMGTVITSTELVFGALLGYIFFREVPAPHELLGGALIFTGSILGSMDFARLLKFNHDIKDPSA